MNGRVYVVVPTLKPVGGVIKTLDYAIHALGAGRDVVVVSPEPYGPDLPIAQIDRLAPLSDVRHVHGPWFGVRPDEFVLFAWPTDYEIIAPRLDRSTPHEHVMHLVQNVRHANPGVLDGYARRLLARPMARITTNEIVTTAIKPFVHADSYLTTIRLGHDTSRFKTTRSGGLPKRVRVGYTTWKSHIGDDVAQALQHDSRFEFRSIRTTVDWDELADLYSWADVFLAAPIREEGFYMPALEAMAAGCIVVTPDVGGNMIYCTFGVNSVGVEFESVESYVAALDGISDWGRDKVANMRSAANNAVQRHALPAEADRFAIALSEIELKSRARRHR